MKIKLTFLTVNAVFAIPFLYLIWLKYEDNKYPIKKILYYTEASTLIDSNTMGLSYVRFYDAY